MVVSDTWTVRVCRANARPSPIRCLVTQMVPVQSASRWTVTGSRLGRGGGPAGRSPRSLSTWGSVSRVGLGAEQLAGVEVEQQQHRWFDPDPDLATSEQG